MTLIFDPLRATIITYSHAKVQCQLSVGSEDSMETNGRTERRTEAIALPPSLMRLVSKNVLQLRKRRLTFPNCSKYDRTSSTLVDALSPPTNIFFVFVTSCTYHQTVYAKYHRPTQPPTLSGTGNEYRPKDGDALRLGSNAGWFILHADKCVDGR